MTAKSDAFSEKQVECLLDGLKTGRIHSWAYGSTTISVLKKRGMIARPGPSTPYHLTDEGTSRAVRLSRPGAA